MLLLLSTVLPDVVPLSAPVVPTVEVLEIENAEVWWIENTRSNWMVVEDCWRSDLLDDRWWSLEALVRARLSTVSSNLMVSSDLEWLSTGLCVRIEGLSISVMETRKAYRDLLWQPLESTLHTTSEIENPSTVEPVTLKSIHEEWLYPSDDKAKMWIQKRIWHNFMQQQEHRLVMYAPHKLDVYDWIPQSEKPETVQWLPKHQSKKPLQGKCLIQNTSSVPQIAVTIQVYFDDVSSSQLRILNSILGSGVRSRLSQRLREELGLVYTIGSQFRGGFIEVSYTVDPSNFSESLVEVETVLRNLSRVPPTTSELEMARSMFLLRQYGILEDASTLVRMVGRFNSTMGWDRYIQTTLKAIEQLNGKSISISRMEKRITGPVLMHQVAPLDCTVHSVRIH